MANGCRICGAPRYAYMTADRGPRTRSICRDCMNTYRRENYDAAKSRSHSLKKLYGMTGDEFQARLDSQGGCAACGSPTTDGKYWHVDHDHSCCNTRAKSCGKCVRAILCHGCNTALGNVRDSKERMLALVDYLARCE